MSASFLLKMSCFNQIYSEIEIFFFESFEFVSPKVKNLKVLYKCNWQSRNTGKKLESSVIIKPKVCGGVVVFFYFRFSDLSGITLVFIHLPFREFAER